MTLHGGDPGALEQVARLAQGWFTQHLKPGPAYCSWYYQDERCARARSLMNWAGGWQAGGPVIGDRKARS